MAGDPRAPVHGLRGRCGCCVSSDSHAAEVQDRTHREPARSYGRADTDVGRTAVDARRRGVIVAERIVDYL